MPKSFFLFICCLVTITAFSQQTKSSLSGIVYADNGTVVKGATLLVTHLPSGTIYGSATNLTGNYYISDVKPGGPYQIEVSSLGYEKEILTAIFFKLDEPRQLNITLQSLSNPLLEVRITSKKTGKLAASEKSGPMTNIAVPLISLLPTVKRSIGDFTRLSPQAFGPAIAGGNYRQNFITIDGSEFNNNFGVGENLPGNGAQPISLDAIAEISVNIAPYTAIWESGFIGSAVNIISRAGTNNTEGSVYTYFRNQNNYGYKVDHQQIQKSQVGYRLNGLRVGGPLIINKLFYFISVEQESERYQPQQFRAATDAAPYGAAPNIARPTVAELDNIRSFLLKNYGYETGPYQGYDFENKNTKVLVRLDWNIAKNNTLSIRYNQLHGSKPELLNDSRSPLSPYPVTFNRKTANAMAFSNSNFSTLSNFYSLSAEWNNKITTSLSNTLRASYTQQHEPRTSNSQLFPFIDILKDGVPFTSFGYEPFTYGNNRNVSMSSITDHLHWLSGKSSWTAGVQADYSRTKNSYMPFGTGYYTYASWNDFATGQQPVDFAITYPLNQQQYPEYSFNYLNLSTFLQQKIALTSRLTFTGALRADLALFPQPLPENNLLAQLTFADNQHIHTSALPSPKLLLTPRAAFEYYVKSNPSLRLRGGTGIFTGRIPFVWIVSQARYSGVNQVTQTWQGQENAPSLLPAITSVLASDFKMPQTWKSSLAADLKLPGGFTATLEALLNKDIRGILFKNINLKDPKPLNIAGYKDNRLVYPANNADKYINPLNALGEADPNGNSAMNAVLVTNSNKGYYLTFMAQLEKKISPNFNFSFAYSRSMARNYNDGDGDQTLSALNATPSINGINDPETSYAGYVMPHRIVSTMTYSKQYAKHLRFSIGLLYQGVNEGRFSYTYSKDFIRDGTNKSLIYVPAKPSEIQFKPLTVTNGSEVRIYSSQQQSDAFFAYLAQDSYLSRRKGKYAERNGALLPWRQQFDLRLSHDIFIDQKGKKHTLQFSCDFINFSNLLNSSWGVRKIVNASSILSPANLNEVKPGGTVIPNFQLATVGGKLLTETFRNDYSINSTYQIQFGIRYLFD